MKKWIVLSMITLLTGCAGANISSQIRSGSPDAAMMTRCTTFSTGSTDNINEEIAQYDGWNMVYMSEYTTENKTSSEAVMCFEKPAMK
ncbi:hypothetical protein [Endozoicomonas ascidiicola]|uniref:hypothetical protein n=1 Tax=Endozoicomonas ascidiicola TaxID=1698521 RepID=UPI000836C9EE|nr:hypothetical protein [Endozoicomonas ascidiicola]